MSDEQTSLKEVVADYLRNNPDFLDDYPDVLENLEINHKSGAAVSLIERQVDQLRASNEELSKQFSQLVELASENEQLMSRMHQLTLDLMSIESRVDFFTHLGNSLLNDFNADILQICLFDQDIAAQAGEDVMAIKPDDKQLEPFRDTLDKNSSKCGRMSASKLEFLFGSKARWVQSTALVPLGEKGCEGMMAIGSSDPARFYPGMGTLFLDLLANVISARLADQTPDVQRRSA